MALRSKKASGCCSSNETQPADGSDAVDKQRFILLEVIEPAADRFKMRLGVTRSRRKAWIWPANAAGDITRSRPIVHAKGINRHVLYAEVASLDVEKQCALGTNRAQQ